MIPYTILFFVSSSDDLLTLMKYYQRLSDGAVLKRLCEETVICYCLDLLAPVPRAWKLRYTVEMGYCLETDVLAGCIKISKEAFLARLSQCRTIRRPTLDNPLPTWFDNPLPNRPARGGDRTRNVSR